MYRQIRKNNSPSQPQHPNYQPQQHLLRPFRVDNFFQHDNANLQNRNSRGLQNSSEIRNFDYVRGPVGQNGGPRGAHGGGGGRTDFSNHSRGNFGSRPNNQGNQQRPLVNPNYLLRPMPGQSLFQQPPIRNGNNSQSKNHNSDFQNDGRRSRWSTAPTSRTYTTGQIRALREQGQTMQPNTPMAHGEFRVYEDPALLLASQIEKQTKQHLRFDPNPSNLLPNPLPTFLRDTNHTGGALIDVESLVRPDMLATFDHTPPFNADTGHYHGDRYYEPINQLDQNSIVSSTFATYGTSDTDEGIHSLATSQQSGHSSSTSSSFGTSSAQNGNLSNYVNYDMARNFGNLGIDGGLASTSGNSGFSGNLAASPGGPLFPGQPSTSGTNNLAGLIPFGGQPAQASGAVHHMICCIRCGKQFQSDV